MEIITIVLSALLGVVFVAGGVQKLRAQAQLAGTLEALGVAPALHSGCSYSPWGSRPVPRWLH